MTNTKMPRRFTARLAVSLTVAVVVFAAACSSDGGRGDEITLTTTETPATTPTTTADVDDTTTTGDVDDTTTTDVGHTHDGDDGHTHEPTTSDVDDDRLTYDEIAEFIEETNPTTIVGEDVVNEDGSIGSSVPFDTIPPELLPEPVVVTTPPTTTPTTTEAPSTTEPTTTPSSTTPATDTPTTTTVWREATDRIPVDPPTTHTDDNPLLNPLSTPRTVGASDPIRLEPGMRLVTDITIWFWGIDVELDGAWIVGFVEFNNSADTISMFMCVEGVEYEGSTQNFVAGWDVARTKTEGVYRVLYHVERSDGTYQAGASLSTRTRWENGAAYDSRSVNNLIDVSECW